MIPGMFEVLFRHRFCLKFVSVLEMYGELIFWFLVLRSRKRNLEFIYLQETSTSRKRS